MTAYTFREDLAAGTYEKEYQTVGNDHISGTVDGDIRPGTVDVISNMTKSSSEFYAWKDHETFLPIPGIQEITNSPIVYCTADIEKDASGANSGIKFKGELQENVVIDYVDVNGNPARATVHVYEPKNHAYVLDYGLPVDLNAKGSSVGIRETSTAGKYEIVGDTGLSISGVTAANEFMGISQGNAQADAWDAYGKNTTMVNTDTSTLQLDGTKLIYTPTAFMENADVYNYRVDVKKSLDTDMDAPEATSADGVRMAGTITMVPAEVVYYEDDFQAITVTGDNQKAAGGKLMQSNDQTGVYGYDAVYSTNTNASVVEENLLVHYDFSTVTANADGTVAANTPVADISGKGNNGYIRQSGAKISGDTLTLPGGASGSDAAYVELPTGLTNDKTDMTVSVWMKNQSDVTRNYIAMYIGSNDGNWPTHYWSLKPDDSSSNISSVITLGSWHNNPQTITAAAKRGELALYTVVLGANKMTLYCNGEKVAENPATGISLADLQRDLVGYIGTSPYRGNGDDYFAGDVRDVRIYDRALEADEIKTL